MTTTRALLALSLSASAAGCAAMAEPTAGRPHDTALVAPAEPAAILVEETWACRRADEGCCATLEERVHLARDRGDDRAADEDTERLALACPSHRRDLLAPERGGPSYRSDRGDDPKAAIEYQVSLGDRDQITWAAAYFNGARVGNSVPAGSGELRIAFHVVSGEGNDVGRALSVEATKPIAISRGQSLVATVVLARAEGQPPFQVHIDSRVGKAAPSGLRGGKDEPGFFGPTPPPLAPPLELRDAGAPAATITVWPDAEGRPKRMAIEGYLGSPHLHPRQLGAALEWLRRLRYAPPDRPGARPWSFDERTLRFDRVEVPHSRIFQKASPR